MRTASETNKLPIQLSDVQALDDIKNLLRSEHRLPRLLLVDDDPAFGRIMIKFSERADLQLTYCPAAQDLARIYFNNIDIAIVDYDLQNISGIQLTQSLLVHGKSLPVILISAYKQPVVPLWANNVIRFVHKSAGPIGILSGALDAYRQLTLMEEER